MSEERPQLVHLEASFSGPLPPPGLLREYENVSPGAAREILDAFHEERRHRMEEEKLDGAAFRRIAVEANREQTHQRLIAAGIVAVCLTVITILGTTGHDWLAGGLGGATLLGLAANFLSQRRQEVPEVRSRESSETEDWSDEVVNAEE